MGGTVYIRPLEKYKRRLEVAKATNNLVEISHWEEMLNKWENDQDEKHLEGKGHPPFEAIRKRQPKRVKIADTVTLVPNNPVCAPDCESNQMKEILALLAIFFFYGFA